MQDSVFESWMDHFITRSENLQKPVLLIYEGHSSHMTYGTVRKTIDNNIVINIMCLPPNTSHAWMLGFFHQQRKLGKVF